MHPQARSATCGQWTSTVFSHIWPGKIQTRLINASSQNQRHWHSNNVLCETCEKNCCSAVIIDSRALEGALHEQRALAQPPPSALQLGAEKTHNFPDAMNISTPSVADVNSNTSNNIESSTSIHPAHVAVYAPIRLLSSSGQCASAAPHGNLKPSHTPRGIGARARTPTCPIQQWNGERAARSINLKGTDEAVSMRFGRAYMAAVGAGDKGCKRLREPI